jgi:spore coat protein CotH
MLRLTVTALLALSTASLLPADEAASFFDDSAVREIRLYFDDANWYNTLLQGHNSTADPYFPVRVQYGDVVLPKVGARFKGNSSFRRNGIKKSFKLDFNEYDDNATLLGLKKLNLNNGDLQPDMLHEKLFLDFAGKYIAALRAVHIRVYVNDVYYGLYVAIEQPDKTMMESRFGSDEDGNLYEAGESAAATMAYLGATPSAYTSRYELKTNEEANDFSGLISMLDILNNTPAASLPERLEPVMDIENVLHGMALNALFTNLESYVGTASEYFLYQRTLDNKFIHVHWDLNETFGSTCDGTPRLTNPFIMDPFYLPTAAGGGGMPGGGGGAANNARPLLEKLWAVDAYKRLYLQMLARMLREGFDEQAVAARVQELAARIRSDYSSDPNKAYTSAQFEAALTSQVTANGFTTYGLTQFVRERVNYLRPLLNSNARPSDVRLNEVAAGEADPWIELYNLGPGPVTTTGFYLTDDPANPTKWAIPTRTLADGDFLVLLLDGKTAEGETHASFRASASGGKLYLYSSAAGMESPIDTVEYTAVNAGQSYSRVGYYGSNWSLTSTQTSAAANSITTAAQPVNPSSGTGVLLINEIMADNDGAFQDPDEPGAFEDWFEVYNPGDTTIDMSGMYITDNLNNPTKWKVPDGVTIPARGYLVFMADSEPAQGSQHTSWSLSADGESIGIFQTDGTTLIDSVTFGAQRTDVSYGRTSDGAATWSLFAPASPGAANASPLSSN